MLPPIPNEIYLEIIDYFSPSVEMTQKECRLVLCNLALACHFFCAIAVPRIFSVLDISGKAIDKDDSAPSNTAAFCRAVIQGKEPAASLAGHVRKCELRNWHDGGDSPWVVAGFMDMYNQAMKRMPNLCSLYLADVDINKRLLKTICGLKGLKSLAFHLIRFSDTITEDFLVKLTPLELTEFTYLGDMTLEVPSEIVTKIIARLVSPTHLEKFWSVPWGVTKEVLSGIGEGSALVHADMFEVMDDPILWRALERSTGMKTLRIVSLITDESRIPTTILPASSMPKLEALLCPPSMLYLIPGRPLSSIEFSGRSMTSDLFHHDFNLIGLSDLARMKRSSIDVLVLDIPTHFYFLAPIAENFPFLEVLHINYDHMNYESAVPKDEAQFKDTILALTKKWPPNTSVHTLRFDFGLVGMKSPYFANLELQCSMISSLISAFPNLRCVNFVDYVAWIKHPFEETWQGKTKPKHRALIHDMLQRGIRGVRDHDGILEAILNLPLDTVPVEISRDEGAQDI